MNRYLSKAPKTKKEYRPNPIIQPLMYLRAKLTRAAEAVDLEEGQVGPSCWGTVADPHSPTKARRAGERFICPVCRQEVEQEEGLRDE
jgi:hypothetical protein